VADLPPVELEQAGDGWHLVQPHPPEQWDRYNGVPEPGSMATHVAGPYATSRLASASLARHEALEDDAIHGELSAPLRTCMVGEGCSGCRRRRRYLSDQALALRLRTARR
jgi:hypothetical protein